MDIACTGLREIICLAGPHGIDYETFVRHSKRLFNLGDDIISWPILVKHNRALEYLVDGIYANLGDKDDFSIGQGELAGSSSHCPPVIFNPATKLNQLQQPKVPARYNLISDRNIRFFCSNSAVRHCILFNQRQLQDFISEAPLIVAEHIGSFGPKGVTQAELANIVGSDAKTVFHWLKYLLAADLITRIPVASKKSFTYLLVLTHFVDSDLKESSAKGRGTSPAAELNAPSISALSACQRIIDALNSAPGKTLARNELFQRAGCHTKMFRKATAQLCEARWLDFIYDREGDERASRVFRLIRKEADGLCVSRDIKAASHRAKEPKLVAKSENLYRHGIVPVLGQLIAVICESFPDGVTTNELCLKLHLNRKYLYKLLDRVVDVDGIRKVADFVGKEKRLRFFCTSADSRARWLKWFGSAGAASTESLLAAPSPVLSRASSSVSLAGGKETLTRQLRHEALLTALADQKILEVNKDLALRIQTLVDPNSPYHLDLKTLKRSIDVLEKAGSLHKTIVMVPSTGGPATRTLIVCKDLSTNGPEVVQFIVQLQEAGYRTKSPLIKKDFVQSDSGVREDAFTEFGFIFGPLARAKILLSLLRSYCSDVGSNKFDTFAACYDSLPLDAFFTIIGCRRVSKELYTRRIELNQTPLKQLPPHIAEEIYEWRKRHSNQVILLLQILQELQLITPTTPAESLQSKALSFEYQLTDTAPVYSESGIKIVSVKSDADLDSYWRELEAKASYISSKADSQHLASMFEDTMAVDGAFKTAPNAARLATHPQSWKRHLIRDRFVVSHVKKLVFTYLKHEKSRLRRLETLAALPEQDIGQELEALAITFEDPLERLQKLFDQLKDELVRKLSDAVAVKKRKPISDDAEEDSALVSDEEHAEPVPGGFKYDNTWTEDDDISLPIVLAILTNPPFESDTIKWHLASGAFSTFKHPIIIRRHGLKTCRSYEDLERLIYLSAIAKIAQIRIKPQDDAEGLLAMLNECYRLIANDGGILTDLWDREINTPRPVAPPAGPPSGSCRTQYMQLFSNWTTTRSYRQECLLQERGLYCSRKDSSILFNPLAGLDDQTLKAVLALRRVLVSQVLDQANYSPDTGTAFLDQFRNDISNAMQFLSDQGIVVPYSSRRKTRVPGYSLSFNEHLGSILVSANDADETLELMPGSDALAATSVISDASNFHLLNQRGLLGIADVASLILQGSVELDPSHSVKGSLKAVVLKNEARPFLTTFPNLDDSSIWYDLEGGFNRTLFLRLCHHLRTTLVTMPGISSHELCRKMWPLLTPAEVSQILQTLDANGITTRLSGEDAILVAK